MTKEMFEKVLDTIPDVVHEIAAWNRIRHDVKEVVLGYSLGGKLLSKDVFFISAKELLNHLEKAQQEGYGIEVLEDDEGISEVSITVVHDDGTRHVATYTPLPEGKAYIEVKE